MKKKKNSETSAYFKRMRINYICIYIFFLNIRDSPLTQSLGNKSYDNLIKI